MTISSLEQIVEPLGWVLVHSLWQFTLIALLGALIQRTHLLSAAARSNILAALLFSCFLLPWTTWRGIPAPAVPVAGSSLPESHLVNVSTEAASSPLVLTSLSPPDVSPAHPQALPPVRMGTPTTTREIRTSARGFDLASTIRPWLPALVCCWWAGVLFCSLRPVIGWRRQRALRTQGLSSVSAPVSQRLKELAQRLGIAPVVQVWESALVETPALVGLLRPVILLPASLLTSFTAAELDAILAHELAHVRRHDFLLNVFQVVVETLFFYHPGVWLLSGWIRREREHACDDLAVTLLGDRLQYSRALVAAESLRPGRQQWALGFRDGSLPSRIQRILRPHESSAAVGAALLVGGLTVAVLVVALLARPERSSAQSPEDGVKNRNDPWEYVQYSSGNPAGNHPDPKADVPVMSRTVWLRKPRFTWKLAMAEVAKDARLNLQIDEPVLKEAGFDVDRLGMVNFDHEPLSSAVRAIQQDANLDLPRSAIPPGIPSAIPPILVRVRGENIEVTTHDAISRRQQEAIPAGLRRPGVNIQVEVDLQGNVEDIRISQVDVVAMAQLANLAATDPRWSQVKSISLEGIGQFSPSSAQALTAFSKLEKLSAREVNFQGRGMGDDLLRAAGKIPSLREISLAHCDATDEGLKFIEQLPELTSLTLDKNWVTDAGMASVARLRTLRKLNLTSNGRAGARDRNRITNAGLRKLAPLTSLRELNLVGLEVDATELGFPSLTSLSVGGPRIDDAALQRICEMPTLQQLSMFQIAAGESGMGHLAKLTSLRSLTLCDQASGDAAMKAIESLPVLQRLELIRCRLSPEAVASISRISSLQALKVSEIAGRESGTFSKDELLVLRAMPNLRELLNGRFAGNAISGQTYDQWVFPQNPRQPGTVAQGDQNRALQPPVKNPLPMRERIVSLKAESMPLREVFGELARQASAELKIEEDAFQAAGLDLGQTVTLTERELPLDEMMPRIYFALGFPSPLTLRLQWRTGENSLRITTTAAESARVDAALPPFLREFNQKGLLAEVDEEGFVQGVTANGVITDDILARLPLLVHPGSKWSRLRSINFEVLEGITPEGLNHLAAFGELEVLQLYEVNAKGPGLGDAAIKVAAKLPKLRELSLNECGVTDAGMAGLEAVPWLTSLHLAKNGITDAGMVHLAKLTRLRVLDVNSIVRTQKYGANSITDAGLQYLAGMTELEELNLTGLLVSGKHLNFPRLQRLNVSGPGIDDAALENIAKSRDLRYLYLGHGANVTRRGLALIGGLPELRRVSLNGPVFSDESLALIKPLPKLESVELTFLSLSDAGLKTLSEMKGLRRIDLRLGFGGLPGGAYESAAGTNVTAVGLAQLKDLPELRELWLTDTRLATYQPLSEIKQLRSLTLFMCPITQLEFNQLEEALPETNISASSGGGGLRSIRREAGLKF